MISSRQRDLGLDPGLPQLSTLFDLPAVSKLYEGSSLGTRSGLGVRARQVHDVSHQPSIRCQVAHELTLERGDDEPLETIGVVDVRPGELIFRPFHEDPDLPWLAEAIDLEKGSRHLEALALAPECRIVRVVPVRYKLGSRCLLRFDLEVGSVPRALYGKILAMDGGPLWRTLIALRDIGPGRDTPRVLQPLAYCADLHMFLLPEVAGCAEFRVLAFNTTTASEARLQWMRKAGAVLANLHAVRVPTEPPRRITADAEDLLRFSSLVARAAPTLALPFDEAIGWLEALTDEDPSTVASHGAFRTDQLLVEGGEPLMIDLDKVCWANPARDVGNFLAYLRWKAIREPHHSSFIEAAIPSFLEGYGSVRALPGERWTARYEAASMLKIVGRRFRNLDVRQWALVPQLLDAARALLAHRARNGSQVGSSVRAANRGTPTAVGVALDVGGMTERLRTLLAPFDDGGATPVVTRADLIWRKPDHRWTIRYTLAGDGDEILGKMYRDAGSGRWVHEIMRWLWDYAASGSPELGVPRPLGWIPELSMLVYLPVGGRVLGDAILDERAATYMDLAAAWLSALHRSGLPLDRAFDVGNELANLRAWSSIVGDRYPDEAAAADRISRRLSERSSELGAESGRPIHKDFHYQHVFVADRASVIDFDEFRLGDPNFDLAHFCAYLTLLGCRLPAMADVLGRHRDRFLVAYSRQAGWHMDGRFPVFYAYSCLKIARQLCGGTGVLPRPYADEQRRQTSAMLAAGIASLDGGLPGAS